MILGTFDFELVDDHGAFRMVRIDGADLALLERLTERDLSPRGAVRLLSHAEVVSAAKLSVPGVVLVCPAVFRNGVLECCDTASLTRFGLRLVREVFGPTPREIMTMRDSVPAQAAE